MPSGGQTVSWKMRTLPKGNLHDTQTGMNVSYLSWEADTTAAIETFVPNRPSLHDSNYALVSLRQLTPYLDKALLALGIHTAARTSFITYWLPSFNKHKNIALRFLPREVYEKAAPLDVQPKPDVIARVFLLFEGVEDADLEYWLGSAQQADGPVDFWAVAVGIDKARVLDSSAFRVIEWGGMEIRG
ncbi:hypothetical protein BKA70DRAFT_1507276 [Coprinopsis sp. MPI-PUGE-AT-0042]|nr:hypothetical protein BKA70DRAFT_1507276 [Coprinopsis sp. MPI-PUGE-AT-0042]